ncbi:SbcC/MukB-like Walker B domain-containing protein [Myceligenerans indicum]|uniref:Nuclease SbcCD subunit C n=1 Tax=Myceligenerans indicum TaxID=2593663 RepID=A0ABS1LR59_9MICO|nr:SbcC/MukB-like Walker B domain-containing protein [Myceligenerans indicum]MBL0888787.1 hypothetical protein [Myceligenerans indicum]
MTNLDVAQESALAAVEQRRAAEVALAALETARADQAKAEDVRAAFPARRETLTQARETNAKQAARESVLQVRLEQAQRIFAAANEAEEAAKELRSAEDAVAIAEQDLAEARKAKDAASAAGAELPSRRRTAEEELGGQAATAATVGELMEQLKAAKKVAKAASQAEELQTVVEATDAAQEKRHQETVHAVEAERAAHLARIAGVAGELAAELQPGDPCQVCGSTEHPVLALQPADDEVSAVERVAMATQLRLEAEERLQDAVSMAATAREQRESATAQAEGLTTDEAQARVAQLTAQQKQAKAAEKQRDDLAAQVDKLNDEIAQVQGILDAAIEDVTAKSDALHAARSEAGTAKERLAGRREAAANNTSDEAHTRVEDLKESLAAAERAAALRDEAVDSLARLDEEEAELTESESRHREETAVLEQRHKAALQAAETEEERATKTLDAATEILGTTCDGERALQVVEHRQEEAADAIDCLTRALDAERAGTEAGNALKAHQERLGSELAARGYESVEALTAVLIDDDHRQDLTTQVRSHENEYHRVTTALQEIEAKELPEPTDDDVAATKLGFEAAASSLTKAHERTTIARTRFDAVNKGASQVERALESLNEARGKAEPVIRMAQAATGDRSVNDRSITLTTFVLMRRFEDVVDAANARLSVMSNGRYELERTDQRESKSGRKLGLALRVVDHDTERSRDPATLSGGETFYVSLCLALGLTDVVTAEAGGVDLETLFIDEGFGSLDPETLEVVVAELSRLRTSGRTVGVVSHVESLKSVIPERIRVRRLKVGSTLEVVA